MHLFLLFDDSKCSICINVFHLIAIVSTVLKSKIWPKLGNLQERERKDIYTCTYRYMHVRVRAHTRIYIYIYIYIYI